MIPILVVAVWLPVSLLAVTTTYRRHRAGDASKARPVSAARLARLHIVEPESAAVIRITPPERQTP